MRSARGQKDISLGRRLQQTTHNNTHTRAHTLGKEPKRNTRSRCSCQRPQYLGLQNGRFREVGSSTASSSVDRHPSATREQIVRILGSQRCSRWEKSPRRPNLSWSSAYRSEQSHARSLSTLRKVRYSISYHQASKVLAPKRRKRGSPGTLGRRRLQGPSGCNSRKLPRDTASTGRFSEIRRSCVCVCVDAAWHYRQQLAMHEHRYSS
ncbi:hypothetical protein BDP55DRAFT_272886 [Colletotrichum godetiae]|uniref:Uncharacterized protein n=1 Tax=Colletotrichum godetiae TaxID=1209918 RepID=A0AAJ0AFA1_9PEZI|nr:uncharacterized protein BDP55DRAFT_272886 [Colletotrichum godetiae]KAK1672164.1 hypothetical protein BDP55DRAFT_272886 [Colletotrichum godetiae]